MEGFFEFRQHNWQSFFHSSPPIPYQNKFRLTGVRIDFFNISLSCFSTWLLPVVAIGILVLCTAGTGNWFVLKVIRNIWWCYHLANRWTFPTEGDCVFLFSLASYYFSRTRKTPMWKLRELKQLTRDQTNVGRLKLIWVCSEPFLKFFIFFLFKMIFFYVFCFVYYIKNNF